MVNVKINFGTPEYQGIRPDALTGHMRPNGEELHSMREQSFQHVKRHLADVPLEDISQENIVPGREPGEVQILDISDDAADRIIATGIGTAAKFTDLEEEEREEDPSIIV